MLHSVLALLVSHDVDTPVITLDLSDDGGTIKPFSSEEHFRSRNSLNKFRHESSFFTSCPAGMRTNAQNCKIPVARAFDHHEGRLDVTESIHLVNLDGKIMDGIRTQIDFTKRSEYMLDFKSRDSSGNSADPVNYALLLNDHEPPLLTGIFPQQFPKPTEQC